MVLPKRGQDLPHQLKIKTIARDMPTNQPDLGRPSLRLSSQVTLGCDKVTFKMNHHWEIHHAAEHLMPLDEHEGDRDARVHLLRHLGSSVTASCSCFGGGYWYLTRLAHSFNILHLICISFAEACGWGLAGYLVMLASSSIRSHKRSALSLRVTPLVVYTKVVLALHLRKCETRRNLTHGHFIWDS